MTLDVYLLLLLVGLVVLCALVLAGIAAVGRALFDSPPTKKRDDYGEGP